MAEKEFRGQFYNPHQKRVRRGFTHFLLWRMGFYKDKDPLTPLPQDFVFPNPDAILEKDKPKLLWINHSTFWIELAGKGLLVDPIWSDRCSPLPFIGPKRHHQPGIEIDKLPHLDFVIISHNHYDHMDLRSIIKIAALYPKVVWIVPYGVRKQLLRALPHAEEVIELHWWERLEKQNLTFTSVPAQHFSGRGLFDRNRTLWMGCVVEARRLCKRFYFAGDTGYNEFDFKKIGERFGSMDLSILPIGVYTPRRFMQPVHINPEESVMIHRQVGSKLSVGGHFGTFKLSSDAITRPPYDLYQVMQRQQIPWQEFRVLRPGQYINW